MKINEIFYSVQGEGYFLGQPSIFIRLSGCNLRCDWCDTKYALSNEDSHDMSIEEIISAIKIITNGFHHKVGLVITGGEPLLQQNEVTELIAKIISEINNPPNCFISRITIETNGTIIPNNDLLKCLLYGSIYFAVSPKKQLINSNALTKLLSGRTSFVKFVINDKEDYEWIEKIINENKIDDIPVYLMPQATTREQLLEKLPDIVEYSKDHGYNVGIRLQTFIWNNEPGV